MLFAFVHWSFRCTQVTTPRRFAKTLTCTVPARIVQLGMQLKS